MRARDALESLTSSVLAVAYSPRLMTKGSPAIELGSLSSVGTGSQTAAAIGPYLRGRRKVDIINMQGNRAAMANGPDHRVSDNG